MSAIPTIKVLAKETNTEMIINEEDFDDKIHEIVKPKSVKVKEKSKIVSTVAKVKLTKQSREAITK